MPTVVRAVTDERDGLLAFLEEQRAALRRATHGLSDEQAAARPTASGLSVGGLVKHLTAVELHWMDILADRRKPKRDQDTEFRLTEGETLSGLVVAYRKQAEETDAVVTALDDLGRTLDISSINGVLPPDTIRSVRWVLSHLIQETARHAGHADILREQLDGATATELVQATGTPWIV